jgi:hypothetical protein
MWNVVSILVKIKDLLEVNLEIYRKVTYNITLEIVLGHTQMHTRISWKQYYWKLTKVVQVFVDDVIVSSN